MEIIIMCTDYWLKGYDSGVFAATLAIWCGRTCVRCVCMYQEDTERSVRHSVYFII